MIGYPLDSHVEFDENNIPVYDRAVTSAPLRKLIKKLFSDGIMPNVSTNMQVSAGTGLTVVVDRGFAICNGCLKLEEDKTQLKLDAGDTTYDRIDTVVLRLDDNDAARSCEFAIIKGIPSANPFQSPVKRSESVWELGLANIRVPAGARAISNSNITDMRYKKEMCGVISALGELDSDGIYQQVQADLSEFKETEQAEFIRWFAQMKDQLSSDAAGNLQRQINVERARINALASLKDGSTTGDAELQDVRVGIDGTAYPSAGEAVRVQVKGLQSKNERLDEIIDMMYAKTVVYGAEAKYKDMYLDCDNKTLYAGSDWDGLVNYMYEDPEKQCDVWSISLGKKMVIDFREGIYPQYSSHNLRGRMYVVADSDRTKILDIVDFNDLKKKGYYQSTEDSTIYYSTVRNYQDSDVIYTVSLPILDRINMVKELAEENPTKVSQLTNDAGYITQQDLDGIAQYYVMEISTALKSGAAYTDSAVVSGLKIGSSWDGIDAHKETKRGYDIWSANALSSQILDFTDSVLKDATLYVVTDGVIQDIVNYKDFTKSKTYKFTTTSSKYAITAEISDGTPAFVNFGEYNQSQRPNQAERTKIEIQNGSEAEVFRLKDVSAAKYLHFHKNAAKLYFDRCSSPCMGADDFELYIRSESDETSPIKGYEKVTSISQITTGVRCLIASQGEDGSYYVMRPMLRGANYEYVAKVISVGDGMIGQLATAVATFDGAYIELEKCLYTFDCDNMIYISATTDDLKKSDLAFKVQKLEDFSNIKRRLEDLSNVKANLKEVAEQMDAHRTVLYGELGVAIDPTTERKYTIPVTEGPIRNALIQACTDAGTTADKIFDKLRMVVDFGGAAARQAVYLETTSPLASDAVIVPIALAGDDICIGSIQYDRLNYEFVIRVPEGCISGNYEFSVYLERL